MRDELNVASFFEMIKGLNKVEQSALAEQIMQILASNPTRNEVQKARRDLCKDLGVSDGNAKPDCPRCGAKANLGYIIKKGMNKGAQRYYCKACGRYFVPTTNTAFAFTRKDAGTWRKFIQMTISGESLRSCEEACNVSHLTAFTWRHKILNAFVVNQSATQMCGTVEVDEMLISINYKGNHIKGSFGRRTRTDNRDNGLPRASYKRGTDNVSKSSKDKVCVFCMVENGNRNHYAAVPGVGFMTDAMLDATLAKHVNKEKVMLLADDYKVTRKYFIKNGYTHITLRSNTSPNPNGHKPEIRGELHLQHVNSMHRHIRNFLKPYYGVSSKYLAHYVALFVWLKSLSVVKQKKNADKVSAIRAATPDCYISGRQIRDLPAVPKCA